MSTRHLAAGLAGALCLAAQPTTASAADLYGSEPTYRYGQGTPYDDPRYADMYRHPAPPAYTERYVEKYERYDAPPPPPPRHFERYDRYEGPAPGYDVPRDRHGYLAPMRPPQYRSYAERECLPKREVAQRLESQGWIGIDVIEQSGQVARLKASRPNGSLYDITIDKCTGQIVEARVVPPPSYAWAPPRPPRGPYRGY